MAKDKKAKSAEKKARVAQKTEKKVAQKEKKASKKPGKGVEDQDTDDDQDIDSVLAAYAKEQERYLKVTESASEPPSARSSATLLASPTDDRELLLFGGEYYNGALAKFYNDLFIYHTTRDEWRIVTSPNSPLPRSGHAWCRAGNKSEVYLFGGEFSSPKQGTFYHYNDFWKLDPSAREWTKIESEKSRGSKSSAGSGAGGSAPSARSGHRMTYFKNYIILFGGFQDTSSSTKYLNDLWIYDINTFRWHQPVLPPASARPEARSSFSFLPRDDGAALYGGYARVKASATSKGGGSKGGKGGVTYEVLKPMVYQDCWFLRITPPAPDDPEGALPTVRWEKRKRPVNAPQPPRAGATMAYHKGRGVQFGGVHDVENSEEGIESEFFNKLSVWNIERNRCFELSLRRPRTQKVKAAAKDVGGRRDRGRRGEEELLANLKKLEMEDGLTESAADGVNGVTEHAKDDEEEDDKKVQKPVFWEMPHQRFNAQLAVQDDVLYIYGGTFEKDDREYTFDEMWSIDLGSLAGVTEVFKRELEDWQGEASESEDEEEDDEEESEVEAEVDAEALPGPEQDAPKPGGVDNLRPSSIIDSPSSDPSDADTTITEPESGESALTDSLPHPRPFESLRDFYARTSNQWQEVLLEELKRDGTQSGRTIKEVRKGAFERAEEKWWDCREEIQALEDEQEEAGIGEVVNLADKASAPNTGAAKRR